jgi:transcriptional regulator with XRE-family HTH domain
MISTTLRNAVRLYPDRIWQLARRIGVHPTVVSKWLSGSQPPKAGDPRVIALGALVGVSADRCFAGVDASAEGRDERLAVTV